MQMYIDTHNIYYLFGKDYYLFVDMTTHYSIYAQRRFIFTRIGLIFRRWE